MTNPGVEAMAKKRRALGEETARRLLHFIASKRTCTIYSASKALGMPVGTVGGAAERLARGGYIKATRRMTSSGRATMDLEAVRPMPQPVKLRSVGTSVLESVAADVAPDRGIIVTKNVLGHDVTVLWTTSDYPRKGGRHYQVAVYGFGYAVHVIIPTPHKKTAMRYFREIDEPVMQMLLHAEATHKAADALVEAAKRRVLLSAPHELTRRFKRGH